MAEATASQGQGITRREFLEAGSLGVLGLTWGDLLRMRALGAAGDGE